MTGWRKANVQHVTLVLLCKDRFGLPVS